MAKYATAGAGIGSVIPGVGTAIGAGVGSVFDIVSDLFGGKKKPSSFPVKYVKFVDSDKIYDLTGKWIQKEEADRTQYFWESVKYLNYPMPKDFFSNQKEYPPNVDTSAKPDAIQTIGASLGAGFSQGFSQQTNLLPIILIVAVLWIALKK